MTDDRQIVYLWHDRDLDACKIGKTNTWKRFEQRLMEGYASNPHIRFIGAWRSKIAPKSHDAGEVAARGLERAKFGSGAREWFLVGPDEAFKQCCTLFGEPSLDEPVESSIDRPYDIMGSTPKANALSRIWIHRECRPQGFLKVSDNSWWRPNIRAAWANTFNPSGFELLASYEWPDFADRPEHWLDMSKLCRRVKLDLQSLFPVPNLLPVQEIGWLSAPLEDVKSKIVHSGLVEFKPSDGIRPGVKGQGEDTTGA